MTLNKKVRHRRFVTKTILHYSSLISPMFLCRLIYSLSFALLFLQSADAGSVAVCEIDEDGVEVCSTTSGPAEGATSHETIDLPPMVTERNKEEVKVDHGGLLMTGSECVDDWDECTTFVKDYKKKLCPEALAARCAVSCKICQPTAPSKMRMTIGVEQEVNGNSSERGKTQAVVDSMIHYLETEVLALPGYSNMYKECQNQYALCSFWTSIGECNKNSKFMTESCMLACQRCNQHPKYNK